MRIALLLLFSAFAVSGCADDGPGADDGADEAVAPADVMVPDDIVFRGSLKGVGQVSQNAPCAFEDRQCVEHAVTVPDGEWNVTFTLIGTNGPVTSTGQPYGTDYDLFVTGVGESTNPPGEADSIQARLDGGQYTAQVVAWHDIDGSYTLTVSFAPTATLK